MVDIKRLLAGAGAAALLAAGAVIGVGGPASAAPSVSISPSGPVEDGQQIQVTLAGFSPNAPVAVGVCPTGRDIKGAGDCGQSKEGHSKLITADASGGATTELTIKAGPLGNSTAPKATCPPCSISAANIGDASEFATTPLTYADAGGADTEETERSDGANVAADADAADSDLASTGPREVAILALLGYALLQLGLIVAIRSHRSGTRRVLT